MCKCANVGCFVLLELVFAKSYGIVTTKSNNKKKNTAKIWEIKGKAAERTEMGLQRWRAEWWMICPLYRTRQEQLFRSPRKQTFCLQIFWVRNPQGETRSRTGLAFLWPLYTLACESISLSRYTECDLNHTAGLAFQQDRPHTDHVRGDKMCYLTGCSAWLRTVCQHIQANVSILMYLQRTSRKDSVTGSQWQPFETLNCGPQRTKREFRENTRIISLRTTSFMILIYLLDISI